MTEYPLAKCEGCGVLIPAACPYCVDCEPKFNPPDDNQEDK